MMADNAEILSSDESRQEQGQEFSDEDDGALWTDEDIGETTRSRAGSELSRLHSTSFSPEPTLEDCLSELIRLLELWESPEDLERLYPPTLRSGFQMPNMSEADVLHDFISLKGYNGDSRHEALNEIDLEDFCVYRSPDHQHAKGQFEYLSVLASSLSLSDDYVAGSPYGLLDGFLTYEDGAHQVVAAEIIAVKIGEAESAHHSIWVMTTESQKMDYWYHLKSPLEAYEPYWTTFTWLADFSKLVIDYLHHCSESRAPVHLSNFRVDFWTYLCDLRIDGLEEWHDQCKNRTDFRQDILAHSLFLYGQASLHQVGFSKIDPVWTEIGAMRPRQPSQGRLRWKKTPVTPNVATSFSKFTAWQEHDLLDVIPLSPQVGIYQDQQKRRWEFPGKLDVDQSGNFITSGESQMVSKAAWILEQVGEENRQVHIADIEKLLGSVVILRVRDDDHNYNQYEFRYAWVKYVKTENKMMGVTWLVLPSDTICGSSDDASVFYPVGDELFFTDQCTCQEVSVTDIVQVVEASVFDDRAATHAHVFVHSLYCEEDESIIHVTESELLSCQCLLHDPEGSKERHGPTPRGDKPKLRGLSLFSGCGLFDHAFTSNGGSEIVWAIEHCDIAARSYKANDDLNRTEMNIASVEDAFKEFASGRNPMPDVDFIIGGFPCPFYSKMNTFKNTRKSQKDGSLLVNMLSWIEIFLPPYVLMENVPNMDRLRPNACRQAICHLVALGYQVRVSVHMDAKIGGASIRERLFIVAAAPGVFLPDSLLDTHGPRGSGLRKIRTVSETIGDLPPIENDTTINIQDPSHVPLCRLGVDFTRHVSYRNLVKQIPVEPKSMSLSKTYRANGLLPHQRRFFEHLNAEKTAPNSKCLQRVDPDAPFRTVCTVLAPMDARFSGVIIHPTEHRTLSLREGGTRAMGMPDRFLLAGTVEERYKQCGNAVPWAMGAGWGRTFSRAWFASLERSEKREERHIKDESWSVSQGSREEDIDMSSDLNAISRQREDVEAVAQERGLAPATEDNDDHDNGGDNGIGNDSESDSDDSIIFLEVRPAKDHRAD